MIGLREFEKLLRLIEELRIESESGAVILVEGRKDTIALRKLGVRGEIIETSTTSNHSIFDAVGERKVVIFTDWDNKGKKLKTRLSELFRNADTGIWDGVSAITGRYIHSVEELPDFIESLYIHHRKRM
ncbi:toprim domain-containing protein [Geoglobus acetivorans]|uniref:TOPRIM domain-containing protein n=1 Tax=Geoglobus acetivorans TaxID=565033 RepID=A0A0A7GG22_GEOAI|nr:TOPRIM domain-containing protein [Geoglobus acetivorans]